MKYQSWQTTQHQQILFKPMDDIKEKYAKVIANFIYSLPKQHQQIAYLLAQDVGYELALCMSRKFLERRK